MVLLTKTKYILTKGSPEMCMLNVELVLNENIMCMFKLMNVKNVCVVTNKLTQYFPATHQFSLVSKCFQLH